MMVKTKICSTFSFFASNSGEIACTCKHATIRQKLFKGFEDAYNAAFKVWCWRSQGTSAVEQVRWWSCLAKQKGAKLFLIRHLLFILSIKISVKYLLTFIKVNADDPKVSLWSGPPAVKECGLKYSWGGTLSSSLKTPNKISRHGKTEKQAW